MKNNDRREFMKAISESREAGLFLNIIDQKVNQVTHGNWCNYIAMYEERKLMKKYEIKGSDRKYT